MDQINISNQTNLESSSRSSKSSLESSIEESPYLSALHSVSEAINSSENFQKTLDQVVQIISDRLNMEVCSIYLFEEDRQFLVLESSYGLRKESLSEVKMKLGEGVVPLAIEEMKPILIRDVQKHSRYLYFSSTGEELFHSFLALPILDKNDPIGVLVVQKKQEYDFHINEINILQILSSQISGVIQVAKLLEKTASLENTSVEKTPHGKTSVEESKKDSNEESHAKSKQELKKEAKKESKEKSKSSRTLKQRVFARKMPLTLKGIPTSFGYGSGQPVILDDRYPLLGIHPNRVSDMKSEVQSFESAIEKSKEELIEVKKKFYRQIPADSIQIFDAHIMILEDSFLKGKILKWIEEGYNSAYATLQVIQHYVNTFSRNQEPFIQEKVSDIQDLGMRLIRNIQGTSPMDFRKLPDSSVIVASFLTPSTTANLEPSKVRAIVTERGGSTSHASILARSLEIPAVVGVENLLARIATNDYLIVDGNTGFVFLNPSKELIREYRNKENQEIKEYHQYFLSRLVDPLKMKDGKDVQIRANIGFFHEIDSAKKNGAKSIGLFRTEFLYMQNNRLPHLEEQYRVYKEVAQAFPDGEIIIRTLDIGGDKTLPYLNIHEGENPFLGYKSTRFLLDHPSILLDQMKSILRATVHGSIQILFPMISSLNELEQLRNYLELAKESLRFNQIPFHSNIRVGIMLEVPSVIFQIEEYQSQVDFICVGTNDLVQYILAVDRDNEKLSHLYNPLHPSVLRALDMIFSKVRDIPISVCGEMSSQPQSALALLSLGVIDLSVVPSAIPYLHYLSRRLDAKLLKEVRKEILSLSETQEIERYLSQVLAETAPEL